MCIRDSFFSEGQKNLVNSEDKENLSNYQLLKQKPSVSSSSLHFSKLITVVQFFFPVTLVLQWFQLNFGAGNFRGRRLGWSALRMLRRLTAVSLRAPKRLQRMMWRLQKFDLLVSYKKGTEMYLANTLSRAF